MESPSTKHDDNLHFWNFRSRYPIPQPSEAIFDFDFRENLTASVLYFSSRLAISILSPQVRSMSLRVGEAK